MDARDHPANWLEGYLTKTLKGHSPTGDCCCAGRREDRGALQPTLVMWFVAFGSQAHA